MITFDICMEIQVPYKRGRSLRVMVWELHIPTQTDH